MRPSGIVAYLVVVTCVWESSPAAANSVAEDEKVLIDAGLKTDAAALLSFFRQRTLSEADRTKLAATVRLLGHTSYPVREKASADLVAAGRGALPFLRAALDDPDLEIARRAEQCLDVIEQRSGAVLATAAARLVAARKPAGAAKVLLAYYPAAAEDSAEEEVLAALLAVGLQGAKADPALTAALASQEPARRAAAAFVLGRSRNPNHPRAVTLLLTDPDVKVRFYAAWALVAGQHKAAVAPLIALLTDAPVELAREVETLLFRIAGDAGPAVALETASPGARQKCRAAWEAWWQAAAGKVDLSKVDLDRRDAGLTVVADLDQGCILVFGPDFKERWRVTGFRGPVDAHVLPNGNLLVAENHNNVVTERDKSGRIVWQRQTSTNPASCQRLANGNTFISTSNQLLEVTPAGKEVFTLARSGGGYCARKLRNGHIVLIEGGGKIVTLDATGKEIRSFTTGGITSWSSVDVLPNGNCLVCCSDGKVVEFDGTGKRVWQYQLPNAVSATRLANGHTLVCDVDGRRVLEVNRSGQTVRQVKTEGRPWHVRRQ
jgi:HEAT repeat protein